MPKLDFSYYSDKVSFIVGVDEAGRGPLAGPVVAGAVIFPSDYYNEKINDSKQLNEKQREELYDEIISNALSYGIGIVEADEIDEINIYEAARKAMKIAISKLNHEYQLILTDAMPIQGMGVDVIPIIKGDAKCQCIAAASIIAKVTRDKMMTELETKYPNFKFSLHKGYGTKLHLEELDKYGPIEHIHRKTYKPVRKYFVEQLKLF